MHGIYQQIALRSLSTVYLGFLPNLYNTTTQPTLMLPLHLLHPFDKLSIVYQVSLKVESSSTRKRRILTQTLKFDDRIDLTFLCGLDHSQIFNGPEGLHLSIDDQVRISYFSLSSHEMKILILRTTSMRSFELSPSKLESAQR